MVENRWAYSIWNNKIASAVQVINASILYSLKYEVLKWVSLVKEEI